MIEASHKGLAAGTGDKTFYESKLKTADFFFAKVLPETAMRMLNIQGGAKPVMALAAENF
jgi:hypothetical protein